MQEKAPKLNSFINFESLKPIFYNDVLFLYYLALSPLKSLVDVMVYFTKNSFQKILTEISNSDSAKTELRAVMCSYLSEPLVQTIDNYSIMNSVATVNKLKGFAKNTGFAGYYSSLLIASCYLNSIGVMRSTEKALEYLEHALTQLEKKAVNSPTKFMEKFIIGNEDIFKDNSLVGYSVAIRYYSLEFENEISSASSHGDRKKVIENYLTRFNSSLAFIKKDDLEYEQKKIIVGNVLTALHRKSNQLKIRHYCDTMQQALVNSDRANQHYSELNTDPLLTEIDRPEVQLFLEQDLLTLSGSFKASKDFYNASRFYLLHHRLTQSPASAIELAELAVNGALCLESSLNDKEKTKVYKSNFPEAIRYYRTALQLSAKQLNVVKFKEAVSGLRSIEDDTAPSLQTEIKDEIDNYLQIMLDQVRNQAQQKFDEKLFKKLLWMLYELNSRPDLFNQLYKIHNLLSKPNFKILFSLVLEEIPCEQRLSHQQTYKMIMHSMNDLLSDITADLSIYNTESLNSYLKIVSLIGKHAIISPGITTFLKNMYAWIAKHLLVTVQNADLSNLLVIADIIKTAKELKKENKEVINLSDTINYWLARTRLESNYRQKVEPKYEPMFGNLSEIYKLSDAESKNLPRPFFKLPYIKQLKSTSHPEAYLKISELLLAKNIGPLTEANLNEVGCHLIQAMLLSCPQDGLDIYKTICLAHIFHLNNQVKDESCYTDQHRSIAHFYFVLAQLLSNFPKDEQRYHLFEGKDHRLTSSSALTLCKNQSIALPVAVTEILLTSLVNISAHIEPAISKEAESLLKAVKQKFSTQESLASQSSGLGKEASLNKGNQTSYANLAAYFITSNMDSSIEVPMMQPPPSFIPVKEDNMIATQTLVPSAPPLETDLTTKHDDANQNEFTILKAQHQQLLLSLQQKDEELRKKDAEILAKNQEIQNKNNELAKREEVLQQTKTELTQLKQSLGQMQQQKMLVLSLNKQIQIALEGQFHTITESAESAPANKP